MLNRLASLAMSTSVLKPLLGKLDIKRYSPSILYLFSHVCLLINIIIIKSEVTLTMVAERGSRSLAYHGIGVQVEGEEALWKMKIKAMG